MIILKYANEYETDQSRVDIIENGTISFEVVSPIALKACADTIEP